ncbi:hypothetical protein HK101_006569 [Irineochytrium annulatum]|nr:hypothetical protein HK101_006569 [Irineochytrium annulatum]
MAPQPDSGCFFAEIQTFACRDLIPGLVPFTQTLAILCWITAATGIAAVASSVVSRRRWSGRREGGAAVLLSTLEISLVLGAANGALTALALTLSGFGNVSSLVFLLWLRLSAVPGVLAALSDVSEGYFTDQVRKEDGVGSAALALGIITIVDVLFWLITCAGWLTVIIVARRGLCERLRDLVDAKHLLSAPSASPSPSGLAASTAECGGVGTTQKQYACATDKRLAASLRGAIWTLTVLGWGAGTCLGYTILLAAATVTIGYPPWMYFSLVGFLYAFVTRYTFTIFSTFCSNCSANSVPGLAPFGIFVGVLQRSCVGRRPAGGDNDGAGTAPRYFRVLKSSSQANSG